MIIFHKSENINQIKHALILVIAKMFDHLIFCINLDEFSLLARTIIIHQEEVWTDNICEITMNSQCVRSIQSVFDQAVRCCIVEKAYNIFCPWMGWILFLIELLFRINYLVLISVQAFIVHSDYDRWLGMGHCQPELSNDFFTMFIQLFHYIVWQGGDDCVGLENICHLLLSLGKTHLRFKFRQILLGRNQKFSKLKQIFEL